MLDITINLPDLTRLAPAIQKAAARGIDRAATVTLQAKTRTVQRTYNRAIPRRKKSGKPAWERSGNFLSGQRIQRPNDLTRIITTEGPAEKYENRLAHLPTGPDGINRTNAAAEDAARIVEPQIQRLVEQEIENAIASL